jgi:hypothetical protein
VIRVITTKRLAALCAQAAQLPEIRDLVADLQEQLRLAENSAEAARNEAAKLREQAEAARGQSAADRPVPVPAPKAMSARARLRDQMARLFADDRGLGVLAEYNGRPDMSEQAKRIQMAWADALIAVHGIERAAGVYAQYASDRQREVAKTAAPVGSWKNLVLSTSPIPAWDRDIHGFLCVECSETFPAVLLNGFDAMCRRCARQLTTPDQAAPLWRAFSHHRFESPGLLREEHDALGNTGPTTLKVRYDDGDERTYTGGEASLLFPQNRGLPNLLQKSAQVFREGGDWNTCVIDAHTEHDGRGFNIVARFTYGPNAEGGEPHPYGFRFEAARLTPTHTAGTPTEYTDLYELLDALITGLYAEDAACVH